MFVYCTTVLRFSEGAAYTRIAAARGSRRFPIILERLASGELNLGTLTLLLPHLTGENHVALLDAARYRSKRDVEQQMATLRPKAPVPTLVRALPARPGENIQPALAPAEPPSTAETAAPRDSAAERPSALRARIAPIAPQRFLLRVTMSQETRDKLQRLQSLMRHAIPDGDPAKIVGCALSRLLEAVEHSKLAVAKRPRTARAAVGTASAEPTRHIPADVKRTVWARDQGRCAFIGELGRCPEVNFIEFHHVIPFAAGGPTTIENVSLRCRAHNGYEAMLFFGPSNDFDMTPEESR